MVGCHRPQAHTVEVVLCYKSRDRWGQRLRRVSKSTITLSGNHVTVQSIRICWEAQLSHGASTWSVSPYT